MAEIDSELENLIGLVAKLSDLDAYARVIQQLREEKREIEERLRSQVTPVELSPQRLRERVTERLTNLRSVFEGEPQGMRDALQELLRRRRLKVGPDPERDFSRRGPSRVDPPNASRPISG